MNKIKPALAIFLATAAVNSFGADWNMVGATAEEHCRLGAVGYEQWSLHADALGTGATVWADSMQNGPAFFRPDQESGYGRVVRRVCSSAFAGSN
jgi:hypothetical protein